MKIGILTLPLHTNYGGILQAYALQTVLERMGHEVEVLNTLPVIPQPIYWKYPLRLLKKYLIDHEVVVNREVRYIKEAPVINGEVDRFKSKHLRIRELQSLAEIKPNEYDGFVVGSDQVWRPIYFSRMWRTTMADAFLAFAEGWNVMRVAYAASFGVDKWEYSPEETQRCAELAAQLGAISVREASGVALCRNHLGVEAVHVLDPTMLLSTTDYEQLLSNSNQQRKDGILLTYMLDITPEKRGLVSRIARERGLHPLSVNNTEVRATVPLAERIKPSVEQWIQGFRDADFVITDSFHACVFSILFGKPFITLGNIGRGMDRFHNLFDMFGLKNHLLTDVSDYNPDADYTLSSAVNRQLTIWREKSTAFLIDALKK